MEEKNTIRIMTFNILVDKRTDIPFSWESRRDHIVSLLKYYNPDIFCVQEALEHQKSYLLEHFPEYECFGVGRNDGKKAGEQVPIFHRKDMFTLINKGTFWLSETPHIAGSIGWDAKRPRTLVWKILQLKASKHNFIIANTHYDNIGKIANSNSAKLINNELSSISQSLTVQSSIARPEVVPNCTMLLCGDFNSPKQSLAYQQVLSSGFKDVSLANGVISYGLHFTYHRFMMHQYTTDLCRLQQEHDRIFRTIDHIFYKGNLKILQYGVLPDNQAGIYPSDHFPVLCDFII